MRTRHTANKISIGGKLMKEVRGSRMSISSRENGQKRNQESARDLSKVFVNNRKEKTGDNDKIQVESCYDMGSAILYMFGISDIELKEKTDVSVRKKDIFRFCKEEKVTTTKERSVDYSEEDSSTINVVRINGRVYLYMEVEGRKIKLLADTVADVSLLRTKTIYKLG